MSALELKRDNPMVRTLPMILMCEVVVFVLAFPGMIYVSHVSTLAASVGCGIGIVLAVLGSALLRRGSLGWVLGWATQAVAVLLGLLTPMMFAAGGLMAAIWVMAMVLGRRIEQTPAPGA